MDHDYCGTWAASPPAAFKVIKQDEKEEKRSSKEEEEEEEEKVKVKEEEPKYSPPPPPPGGAAEYSLRRRPRKDYSKMVKPAPAYSANGLVKHKPNKILDFRTIEWPRDALYNPYPLGEKFEYMADVEAR